MYSRFIQNSCGNITTIFALMLVPIAICSGLAIDYLRMVEIRSDMQAAVDSAALAAASFVDGSASIRTASATSAFDINKPGDVPVSPPAISIGTGSVTVTASATVTPALMNVVGFQPRSVTVKATAGYPAASTCVLTLEPSAKESLYLNSNSSIQASDCKVHVNSTDPQAIYGNSNGDIVAKQTCLAGGTYLNSGSSITPPDISCAPLADPLAWLPVPPEADDSCTVTDKTYSGNKTLAPGVYCGKTEFNAGSNITLNPGTYIFRDGELVVNSGSNVEGEGVMLYFTGGNNARLNVNSGSHIDISAPTTGTFAGIAINQQRNSTADFSILNSDASSKIEGVIYLPDTTLQLNSAGNLSDDTPWTIILVKNLVLNSASVMHVNADYDSSTVPVPLGLGSGSGANVRLTE